MILRATFDICISYCSSIRVTQREWKQMVLRESSRDSLNHARSTRKFFFLFPRTRSCLIAKRLFSNRPVFFAALSPNLLERLRISGGFFIVPNENDWYNYSISVDRFFWISLLGYIPCSMHGCWIRWKEVNFLRRAEFSKGLSHFLQEMHQCIYSFVRMLCRVTSGISRSVLRNYVL